MAAVLPFHQEPPFSHGQAPVTGILLCNLGTPDAPTAAAVRRYLREARPTRTGRIYDKTQRDAFRDGDARRYFSALDEGRLPYRLVHVARFQGKFWPPVRIHDSLAEPIGIYERLP